jgi:hypothetical protein
MRIGGRREDWPESSSRGLLTDVLFYLKANLSIRESQVPGRHHLSGRISPEIGDESGLSAIASRLTIPCPDITPRGRSDRLAAANSVRQIEESLMSPGRTWSLFTVILTVTLAASRDAAHGESPSTDHALFVRLIRPDSQAAEVLKLFEGARVPHPAAALAGWKRATRAPDSLGKPLEAVIAIINPDMVREWRAVDDAELHLDLAGPGGAPRWYAVMPRDDGTLAAAVTAARIADGSEQPALTVRGTSVAVQQIGRIFASRSGDTLVLASSRDELLAGAVASESSKTSLRPLPGPGGPSRSGKSDPEDAGLVFQLDADRLQDGAATIAMRRGVALLKGLDSQRVIGKLGLKGDVLAIEVTTSLMKTGRSTGTLALSREGVDPSWLRWLPAEEAMAVVSLAIEPSPVLWNQAFAMADRVERADPARANVASLRSRFNVLAAAAGTRPEVDLWPRLRGVTGCAIGDRDRPGSVGGALIVLHVETEECARELATDFLPRMTSLFTGQRRQNDPPQHAATGAVSDLGQLAGRRVSLFYRNRDVIIAWGEQALNASQAAAANPDRSVAPLLIGWQRAGHRRPQRIGAIWPARCWPKSTDPDTITPGWRVLVESPPAVWWGWNEAGKLVDRIQFSDLRSRLRDFLNKIPFDPAPTR